MATELEANGFLAGRAVFEKKARRGNAPEETAPGMVTTPIKTEWLFECFGLTLFIDKKT